MEDQVERYDWIHLGQHSVDSKPLYPPDIQNSCILPICHFKFFQNCFPFLGFFLFIYFIIIVLWGNTTYKFDNTILKILSALEQIVLSNLFKDMGVKKVCEADMARTFEFILNFVMCDMVTLHGDSVTKPKYLQPHYNGSVLMVCLLIGSHLISHFALRQSQSMIPSLHSLLFPVVYPKVPYLAHSFSLSIQLLLARWSQKIPSNIICTLMTPSCTSLSLLQILLYLLKHLPPLSMTFSPGWTWTNCFSIPQKLNFFSLAQNNNVSNFLI